MPCLCLPSTVYLGISVISLMLEVAFIKPLNPFSLTLEIIGSIFWTWFLNFICSFGYITASWVLAIVPAVVTFFIGFLSAAYADLNSRKTNTKK